MNILHILKHTKRLNGNVHAAVDLACAQAKQGHAVTVMSREGDFDTLLESCGVRVIKLDHGSSFKTSSYAVLKLIKFIRMQQVEVVHAHMMTSAVVARLACSLRGIPLVTTVHNAFQKSSILMGLGNRVIVVSSAVGEIMSGRGIPAKRLRTVLNGTIGSDRLAVNASSKRVLKSPCVLFVGGLHPRKGVGELIRAFEQVAATIPDATLYIVGEGPHMHEYEALASSQVSAEAIVFVGDHDDPQSFMRSADVFVLPSLADPAPLVLSEAREAGCAVVASHVDGIPELLEHGKAGILVPPSSVDQLAAALISVLLKPASLEQWRRASQHNLDYLQIDRVVRETGEVYLECLR